VHAGYGLARLAIVRVSSRRIEKPIVG